MTADPPVGQKSVTLGWNHRSRCSGITGHVGPEYAATAPRQLWSWDMTYLPAEVLGRWFYLYLILDVF
ncbi:MAG: hypothetical protein MUF80_01870, partial [Burkholderiales bacterium]|nr:hypothetical protein [Burkholderiales bacterium]